MERNQLISLCFIALLVFVLYQVALIFAPFMEAIFWSAILSFAFFPLYSQLRARARLSETTSAMLMTALILLMVIPPLVLIVINLTSQAIDLYQAISAYIREGRLEHLIDQLRSLSLVQKLETNVLEWGPIKESASAWILNTSRFVANFAVSQAGTITKNILMIVLNTILTSVLVFIFLKDGSRIYNFFYQIVPLESGTKELILGEVNGAFAAVIRGQLLTSITQAALAGAAYTILGLPAPIFFAAATFLATLIPFFGAVGIWLPLVIYLVMIQSYIKAIILALFGILVISLVDNIIKPALIGERTRLPYFLLFFGILGGLNLYGLMGVFLAPVLLVTFFALAKIFKEKYA